MSLVDIDYNDAREEYLSHLKKNIGVVGVIEFGEILAPGLSDIDWLVLLDGNKTSNSKYLFPYDEMSINCRNAFQHRPIFSSLSSLDDLGDFIYPIRNRCLYGDNIKLRNKSRNFDLRDITVAFDFLKRQKEWLRFKYFKSFTNRKKVALFKSIGNHYLNAIFKESINIEVFVNKVNLLRKKIIKTRNCNINIDYLRKDAIILVLELEKMLVEKIIDMRLYPIEFYDKYYKNINWTKKIVFEEKQNCLSRDLISIPQKYKLRKINSNDQFSNYFNWKYNFIKDIKE